MHVLLLHLATLFDNLYQKLISEDLITLAAKLSVLAAWSVEAIEQRIPVSVQSGRLGVLLDFRPLKAPVFLPFMLLSESMPVPTNLRSYFPSAPIL